MKDFIKILIVVLLAALVVNKIWAGQVPVHDPSIVVVYKDAQGNSYPEQSANNDRTKYYYVMGTQLGAAYSKDMLDWITKVCQKIFWTLVISINLKCMYKKSVLWRYNDSNFQIYGV